jgi:Cytochrome c
MTQRFSLVVAVSAVLLFSLPGPTQGQERVRQPAVTRMGIGRWLGSVREERVREVPQPAWRGRRPRPGPRHLVGHFFASRYFDTRLGDGRRGEKLVRDKGCVSCHAVYGRGANLAPDLATSNVVGSVDGQLAALWNHGRLMGTLARRQTAPLQELTGRELADIATYLAAVGKGPSRTR